jgi:RNA polymerase sigma-70 factor (ECF subfamily)
MAYSVCLRYLSNQFDAADCLQKSFLKVYTYLDQVQSDKSLPGWIKTLTIRTCLDHIRSIRKLKFDPIDNQKELKNTYVEDYELKQKEVCCADLIKLIELMPEGYKTIFNLAILDEMSHEEIAQECGISVGTSRSQLYKARRYLQSLINHHYGKLPI